MSSIVTVPRPLLRVRTLLGVRVPMRDGVKLSTDVYLPEGPGPFPVILIRTPYSNNVDYQVAGRRLLRPARLRRRDPRRAGPLRLGRRVGAVHPRSPGRLRRPGVVRDPALVDREGRHQRRLVSRAHPVAGRAAPEPPPRRDGAPRGVLGPLPQLGVHGRRLPAGLQPPVGRRPDAHAHQSDAVPLDAAGAALLHPLLAPPAPDGRRARRPRHGVLPGVDPAPGRRSLLEAASATSRRTTRGSTCPLTGSAAGTTSSCRAP